MCRTARLGAIRVFKHFPFPPFSPSGGPGGHREAPRPDLTASAPPNSGAPSTFPFMCRPKILPPWGPKRRFKVSFFGRFRRKKRPPRKKSPRPHRCSNRAPTWPGWIACLLATRPTLRICSGTFGSVGHLPQWTRTFSASTFSEADHLSLIHI